MPPNKRRIEGGNVQHQGRTTVRKEATGLPFAAEPTLAERAKRAQSSLTSTPAASSRYTPPLKSFRLRPGWHKAVAAVLLVVAVGLAVLNDVVLFDRKVHILPGGHSEGYLLLALAIALYATSWFGWYDREQ